MGVWGHVFRSVLIGAWLCSAAAAQSAGSLRGTVTDPSRAVIPGATVTLTNEATKFTRTAVTDERGGYFFATVDPGDYSLRVELSGFRTYEASGLHVSPNDTLGVDIVLQVGLQTETIQVTAQQEIVQTRTGAREGLITAAEIERQSIVGRNPMELLRILPGVVANQDPAANEVSGMFTGASSGDVSINGVRNQNIGITLDGANLRDVGANSGTMNVPNNEFVQEVKVQSSNYAAEFGSSGVQIQALTKSGSSRFHGTVYDYFRPYQLAATDRSRSLIGQEKPKSRFNYPGFTVSGPILLPRFNRNRDKAFFFFGFELARQSVDEGTQLGYVPTRGQREGLFTDYLAGQHLNQPTVVNIPGGFPGAGTPAPNNDLRPYIDPIGRALLNLYPLPNYNDPNNRYNYVFDRLRDENRNQFVARGDYNVTDSTRTYVRLARDKDDRTKYRGLWWNSSGVELPSPIADTSLGRSAVGNVSSVLSPNATNEIIFTWSELKNDNRWEDPSRMMLSTFGISGLQNPFGGSPFLPQIVVNNFSQSEGSLWSANDVDNIFSYNGFARVADSYTQLLGDHALKFGVSLERQYKRQNFNNTANVQLNYAPWGAGSTGHDYADVLVGRPAQAAIGTPAAHGNFVAWNFDAFAQDSWRLGRNFTLEYGLRFGRWTNNAETNDLGAIFRPELYNRGAGLYLDPARQQVNGVAYVRTGQVDRSLTDSRPLQFMPRASFAWDLSGAGSTVLRGGGGVFYNREQGNAQYGVINLPPNAYSATLNAGDLTGIAGGRGLTYSTLALVDPFSALNSFNITSVSPTALDWPALYNASASILQRIPLQQTIEVGYVGSFGRNLAAQRNFNIVPAGGLTGTLNNADLSNPLHRAALQDSAYNSRRPFPALQEINYFEPIGTSNYHALQATLSRQARNFNYLVAYTLSRARGTVGGDFSDIDPLDPENRSGGVLPFDRRHILNVSWTWEVGESAQANRFVSGLVNGWNLAGISTFASGTPLRVGFNQGELSTSQMARAWWGTSDFANFDSSAPGDITPLYTCDPRLGGNTVGDKLLDIGCLGIPRFGETGPFQPPYDLRSPWRMFHDLTIFKNIAVGGDDRRVQLRAGIFNIFNQAFPNPLQNDIDLNLNTECNIRVTGVPDGTGGTRDVCDPTGGFRFTTNTTQNFGKILSKRGHRIIELALRFFW